MFYHLVPTKTVFYNIENNLNRASRNDCVASKIAVSLFFIIFHIVMNMKTQQYAL